MADYLQNVLREHPRTRRLGELIADIAYPISSTVVGCSYIPFHGTLLNGVNSMKETSDFIFQQPYERLLNQFEESRKLKEDLEQQIRSSQIEYEPLKCVECPTCIQREERVAELENQRSMYEEKVEKLEQHVRRLTSQVEELLVTIAEKEGEKEMIRTEVEQKEAALTKALNDLETVRAESAKCDAVRPSIETEDLSRSQFGMLTPESLNEHQLSSSWGIIESKPVSEPLSKQGPSSVAFEGDESTQMDSEVSQEAGRQGPGKELKGKKEGNTWYFNEVECEDVKEETDDKKSGDESTSATNAEARDAVADAGKPGIQPEPPVEAKSEPGIEARAETSVVVAPKQVEYVPEEAESSQNVDEVKEGSVENDGEAPGCDAYIPDMESRLEGEENLAEEKVDESVQQEQVKTAGECENGEMIQMPVPMLAVSSATTIPQDAPKEEEITMPVPMVPVSSTTLLQDELRSSMTKESGVLYLNEPDSTAVGYEVDPVEKDKQTGRQSPTTSNSSHTRSSPIHPHTTPQKNVGFSSFGFGGPDFPQPRKSPTSHKKRHSFFSRHGSGHESVHGNPSTAEGEGEKDSVKEKEKRSFRTRVFSTSSVTHPVSPSKSQRSKSDDESSVNSGSGSSGVQSKDMAALNGSGHGRPDSPSPSTKLGRHHSHFFRDHVKAPLERKASQIAHKGREFFKHESEQISSHLHSHHQKGESSP